MHGTCGIEAPTGRNDKAQANGLGMGIPIWWGLLCLVPLVNLVFIVLLWMAIAEARKKPSWWGVLLIVPVVNLVVPGYLAWLE